MKKSKEELIKISNIVRKDIIEMLTESGSGHPGGSLSSADILTTLYFSELNVDPKNPKDENRDRFVLSKGHAAPVLYSVLARRGFFDPEDLKTLRKIGSKLQGHPNMNDLPGIDMSTGSLGQGTSAAVGMALAGKLDNLTIFIDFNGLQIDGDITKVMNPSPIDKKFEAFGWNVLIIDGHNYDEIFDAIEKSKNNEGAPTAIICKTIKGKGVSFMENDAAWHGNAPNKEQCEVAVKELGGDR